MQKFTSLVIACAIILSVHISQAQKIIVSGKESTGTLQWKDFTGKVDKNSPFVAYTAYKFNTKIKNVRVIGDSVAIEGFEVILELDQKNSWAKLNKTTDALLIHEQGHFNLGILTTREILRRFKQAKFTKSNYQTLLQEIINETSKMYNELGIKYDAETDHSKNAAQQDKWNEFFSRQFAGVN